MTLISKSLYTKYNIIIFINIATSLILLNVNALKAALSVDTRVDQKFIKKNDVSPINSHPKNKTIKFELETNNIMLNTNRFIKIHSLST